MKIGITQRGDACLDLSWVDKLNNVDGVVIISKGFNDKFQKALLDNQNKIIYHATCTGFGGTILEPNVPNYKDKLNHIKNLIKCGFQPRRIVLRIDPIFSYEITQSVLKIDYLTVIRDILNFCIQNKITRVRYSYVDLYKHVQERFLQNNLIAFRISADQINLFQNFFDEYQKKGLIINSCAQKYTKEHRKVGCISKTDFEILGLDINKCDNVGYQRPLCLCCSAKTELLNCKHRCEHKCLYCYWKD